MSNAAAPRRWKRCGCCSRADAAPTASERERMMRASASARHTLGEFHEDLRGALAGLARNVEMSDRAQRVWAEGIEQDAALTGARHDRVRVRCLGRHVEDDDVGLYRRDIEHDARAGTETARDPRGVVVVLRETLDIVIERVQTSRGEDTDLAHRAAQHAAVANGPIDELARTGEQRAPRGTQPLGQRHRYQI